MQNLGKKTIQEESPHFKKIFEKRKWSNQHQDVYAYKLILHVVNFEVTYPSTDAILFFFYR